MVRAQKYRHRCFRAPGAVQSAVATHLAERAATSQPEREPHDELKEDTKAMTHHLSSSRRNRSVFMCMNPPVFSVALTTSKTLSLPVHQRIKSSAAAPSSKATIRLNLIIKHLRPGTTWVKQHRYYRVCLLTTDDTGRSFESHGHIWVMHSAASNPPPRPSRVTTGRAKP